jgi:ketosteroid isomerase-like protein
MRTGGWGRGTSAGLGALGLLLVVGGCGTEREEPKVEVTQEQRNQDLLRRGYESFAKGDLPGALALYDDSIVFHVPGTSQLAGDHEGKAAVGALMRKFRELSGGTFKLQPTQILANEAYGAVLAQASATRNGNTIAEQPIQLWRFEGGKPVEMWLYPRDQRAFDEFWS